MWIAKFRLKDEKDVYSFLCEKNKIDFYANPLTNYEKGNKINLLVSGIISGSEENKNLWCKEILKDKRVKFLERYKDFVFVQVIHPISRESRNEIKVFYNKQYILVKPVHVSKDGWEYWEVACVDRNELNKVVEVACKYYSGELFSIKREEIKNISNLEYSPNFSEKQSEIINLAHKEGYYNYPRKISILELAKKIGKSYSGVQENLRRAENKLIEFFFKYR